MTSPRIGTILAALTLFALAACNTAEGFGEDVEAGGEAIQEGSEDTSDEISD
ncbi:MAG: entericidin A/B family lipoprotein [Paracoccaceae bacterium]